MIKKLLTPSMEDRTPEVVLSMEEEDMMVAEGNDAANEATVILAEVERATQISEGMDDLALVVDRIEEATPVEVELIGAVTQMAVAGSEAEPEAVIPSMEEYLGKRISVESIRANAKKIWETITEWLKKAYEYIQTFWTNLTGSIPRLQKKLAELHDTAAKVTGVKDTGDIKVSPTNQALMVGGKLVLKEVELVEQVSKLMEVADFSFKAYPVMISQLGNQIADHITGFELDAAKSKVTGAEVVKLVHDAFANAHMSPASAATTKQEEENPGYVTTDSVPYLGNFRLVKKVQVYIDRTANAKNPDAQATTLVDMERSRLSGITFKPEEDVAPHHSTTAPEMEALSMHAIRALCGELHSGLDLLNSYRNGTARKQMDAVGKHLLDVSARLNETMNKRGGSLPPTVEQFHRSLINFNMAYGRWMKEPGISIARSVIRTTQSVIGVIEKSLAGYTLETK